MHTHVHWYIRQQELWARNLERTVLILILSITCGPYPLWFRVPHLWNKRIRALFGSKILNWVPCDGCWTLWTVITTHRYRHCMRNNSHVRRGLLSLWIAHKHFKATPVMALILPHSFVMTVDLWELAGLGERVMDISKEEAV